MWRTYVVASLLGHLVWELLQLPLYTIFWTASIREITFAIVHCTAGDVLIAIAVLLIAIIITGREPGLTERRHIRLAGLTIVFGVCYTVFSEWINASIRESWSYTNAMPLLPVLGTGIAPLLQWLVVPTIALALAWRCARKHGIG
jgi:hypothetical protein